MIKSFMSKSLQSSDLNLNNMSFTVVDASNVNTDLQVMYFHNYEVRYIGSIEVV